MIFFLFSFYNRPSPPPTSLTPGPTNTMLKLNGAPGDGDTAASMLSSVSVDKSIQQWTLSQYFIVVHKNDGIISKKM